MIHIYHLPTEIGYWMWLSPYYAQHYKPEWEQKETVTVYIPTRNILDRNAVQQIRTYVERYHKAHHLQKKAEAQTAIDPDFTWTFTRDEKGISIGVRPKHDKALANHPILVKMNLDERARRALQTTIETGQETRISGAFYVQGLPEWIVPDIEQQGEAIVRQILPDIVAPTKVDFVDPSERVLWSIPFVKLTLVQGGTMLACFEGKVPLKPIIFRIEFDSSRRTVRLNLMLDWEQMPLCPSDICEFFDLMTTLKMTSFIRIIHLETGETITSPRGIEYSWNLTPDIEGIRQLAEALVRINSALGKSMRIPDSFTQTDLMLAQEIANILNTGTSSRYPNLSNATATVQINTVDLPSVLKNIECGEEATLTFSDTQGDSLSDLKLFEEPIHLGPAEYVLSIDKIVNEDEIRERVQQGDLGEHELFPVKISVNAARSFTSFPKWKTPDS